MESMQKIIKDYPIISREIGDTIKNTKDFCIEQLKKLQKKIQNLQEKIEEKESVNEQEIQRLKRQLLLQQQQYDEMFSQTLTINNDNPDLMAHFKVLFNNATQERDQLQQELKQKNEQFEKASLENQNLLLQIKNLKQLQEQKFNESGISLDLSSIDNQEIRKFEHSSINNATIIDPTVQSGHTKSSLQIKDFQNQLAQQLQQQNENNNTKFYDLQQEIEYHKMEIEKYKNNLIDYQEEEKKMVKMISDLKRENYRLQQIIDQTDTKSLKLQIKQLLQSFLTSLQNQAQETEGYFKIIANMLELTDQERQKLQAIVNQMNQKKKGGLFR
ncbi:unnamed protein product [Paramecium sonneborni]|nr:unnamed protein product [Paramecium sonneborni]